MIQQSLDANDFSSALNQAPEQAHCPQFKADGFFASGELTRRGLKAPVADPKYLWHRLFHG
jgi:hypothetical protein